MVISIATAGVGAAVELHLLMLGVSEIIGLDGFPPGEEDIHGSK